MFFKHILIGFIILGILGFLYGDHVLHFQANLMIGWMYDFPAYEAYERIVRYYPNSPFKAEAKKMMDILIKRNRDLAKYLETRDKETRALEKKRSQNESFH